MESILDAGEDRGHALQVRIGHGQQPLVDSLVEGTAGRRRHGLGPGVVHEGLRRVCRRHQVGRQDTPRGQDGDPQRRASRHRRIHQLQGRGREEGLGADRRRLRRLVHRDGVLVGVLPELEQLGARDRRVHARGAGRRAVADARRRRRRGDGHLSRPRSDAADRRGHVGVRRSGHAVRHDGQRVAHLPEHGAHQREQPVLRVHVPGRLGVQPVVAQPDEVRAGGRRVRRGIVQGRGADADHGAGNPRRQRQLPDQGDREEQHRLPSARPRLCEPRRAADVARIAVRQRRRPRLRRRHHRADDRRGVRAVGARGARSRRSVRRLREQPRAVPPRDAQASRRR